MSDPEKLIRITGEPDKETTLELNEQINELLHPYGGRERTMWLFLLATRYYIDLEGEDEFDLVDYQMAAEIAMRNAGQM